MNFLYPGFLFALLSVAIPVIIHLFNFRKFKKVYFSNVQLLKEVEQQNSSREKIKNLLILFTRMMAVIFLVLAFSQPYLPADHQKNASLNNAVSIYIDNSYSMEAVNQDGNLLDEAIRKAKELVKSFGINDRFQLLTNDFESKHQRFINRDEFLNAVDEVKISSSTRNLQQILSRQQNLLSGGMNKYSFIISDFQKSIANGKKLTTNPDIQYSFLKLKANALSNIAVDSAWMLSPNHQPNASEKLVVQLKNYADEDANNIPLKLHINSQQKGISSVSIPAGKMIKDTLSFSSLKAGWQKGVISIKDFPVTFDDSLSFAFKVDENLPVLSINDAGIENYIKPLYAADSFFQLTENEESKINYSQFSAYRLIILNGVKSPSSGLAQQLKNYVSAGGTVVFFPNLDGDVQMYNSFLTALSLPKIDKLVSTESQVDGIDLQHPIFKTVFEEIPKNIDLPRVNRYFSYAENNSLNKENILTLSTKSTFFAKYAINDGAVYLSASGLNLKDGNLARHPVFVPLLYRLALNAGTETPLYAYLGGDDALEERKITLIKNQLLTLSAPDFEVIPEVRQLAGKTLVYFADQVKNTGFYNLNLADSLVSVYAFNNQRKESDMHYLSKAEIDHLAGNSNLKIFDTEKDAVKLIAGTGKIGQTLWKLCLILSLIFIAIEILLIRFFNKPKKTI